MGDRRTGRSDSCYCSMGVITDRSGKLQMINSAGVIYYERCTDNLPDEETALR